MVIKKAAMSIKAELAAMKFPPAIEGDHELLAQQLKLQDEYIAWAAPLRAKMEQHLRNPLHPDFDVSYRSWGTTFKAAFSNARAAFLGSGIRQAVQNAVATAASRKGGSGELDNSADVICAAGTAAAVPAFVHEKLTKPMLDETATKSNVPRLRPNPVDDFFPMPGRVCLYEFKNGSKQLYLPKDKDLPAQHADGIPAPPTRPQLEYQVRRTRDKYRKLQASLDQKHLGSALRAVLSGLANVARRAVLSAEALESPWIVGATSTIASGGASAANEIVLTTAKATVSIAVPRLPGGSSKTSCPLFKFDYPDDQASPPSWKTLLWSGPADELRQLPDRAADLGRAVLREPLAAGLDFFVRNVLVTVGAGLAALGYSAVVSSGLSGDRLDGDDDEDPHSGDALMRQGTNSAARTMIADALLSLVDGAKFDVDAAVQAHRNIAAVAAQDSGAPA